MTGEARPADRIRGDLVRSGVVNVGGPFSLRAGGTAAESTYAGIVRLVSEAEKSLGDTATAGKPAALAAGPAGIGSADGALVLTRTGATGHRADGRSDPVSRITA
ncbi:MAG TPA: hypothetical protein VF060_36015 [Trebonia sp.]